MCICKVQAMWGEAEITILQGLWFQIKVIIRYPSNSWLFFYGVPFLVKFQYDVYPIWFILKLN